MLRDIEDIASYLGAARADNESISRRVYKDTSCGAWAKVENGAFVVGSIVEGTDAEVRPEWVELPCSEEDIDRAIENVEAEADFLWSQSENGAW